MLQVSYFKDVPTSGECKQNLNMHKLLKCRQVITLGLRQPFTFTRFYASAPKRFYRRTGILFNDGLYEITLDQRKLKTPKGNLFKVSSEPLALAVAAEWDAQAPTIQQSSMHLSGLCSTAIDNPGNITKYDLVQRIINFLDTDTVLCFSSEEELCALQEREWGPILKWFRQRYDVEVEESKDITGPTVSLKSKQKIISHLLSYNMWAVHGFAFGVETVKSLILTLCCVDRYISVEKAVLLSRLEEEFQTGHWGRVEWAHDLNQQQTQARLAAAVLFIHLNSSSAFISTKGL
ncbi:ATP synthase mitochondrial F1 complex assembly factor 2 [Schistocerca cancellata]|uniref:ATP synthase mitochondrial F1 complex assembly factor 2 n=2 Tax=Schistocerca TaxID=7008 RepID=UPI0021186DB6|nr:ATP synthase mitochondrial F1 complex assembly factor 2 [Schistocerca cancellata]